MWARAGVVFRKEFIDNTRDKRSLMTALFYPLLGPIMIVALVMVIGRNAQEQAAETLKLPVVGAERAPTLMQFLKQNRTEILPAPADPAAMVRTGDTDVVLVVPEGYADEFSAGRPATVQLVLDDSRQSAMINIHRAERLIENFNREIGSLRLIARGVSPAVVEPLAVERVDVATAQSRGARFLGMAPYFIILAIFIGGMYLSIDATVGERERRSLEPLLINPVARWELVLGKYSAALLFTCVALVETLVGFAVVLNRVPLEKYIGERISLGGGALVTIFFICVPMMILAVALQVVLATFCRTFKEAQTYLSLLPLVPAFPGIFLVFLPVKAKIWMMLIPTYGQQLLINQVMRGEATDPVYIAVSAIATLAVGLLLLLVAFRLYERETVLAGR
jgi:sodium transport system permease protein